MKLWLYILYIVVICRYIKLNFKIEKNINIVIGNSFKDFYTLPSHSIICNTEIGREYKCQFISNLEKKADAIIYNGNRKFSNESSHDYKIVMTTEKLSQVSFMKEIGDGKSKYFNLAIDYRLFNNNYHISYPIYSNYDLNELIYTAKTNHGNITAFMNRKNVIYIQRVHYKNRQKLVKELMKHIHIDSFGNDLNNKNWPSYILRDKKVDLIKEYKFCLSIENSVIGWKNGTKFEAPEINNDYVTEKLVDCLLGGSIPIYFGPKNINLFLPHPKAIINFNEFNSIKELADYITLINNDKKLLYKHIQWHENISHIWFERFTRNYSFNYCKICEKVRQHRQELKRNK